LILKDGSNVELLEKEFGIAEFDPALFVKRPR
jgi:hypothetical protein